MIINKKKVAARAAKKQANAEKGAQKRQKCEFERQRKLNGSPAPTFLTEPEPIKYLPERLQKNGATKWQDWVILLSHIREDCKLNRKVNRWTNAAGEHGRIIETLEILLEERDEALENANDEIARLRAVAAANGITDHPTSTWYGLGLFAKTEKKFEFLRSWMETCEDLFGTGAQPLNYHDVTKSSHRSYEQKEHKEASSSVSPDKKTARIPLVVEFGPGHLGLELVPIPNQSYGSVVDSVTGVAEELNIKKEMRLLKVNNQKVDTLPFSELMKILQNSSRPIKMLFL